VIRGVFPANVGCEALPQVVLAAATVLIRTRRSSCGNRFCNVQNTRSPPAPLRVNRRDVGDGELHQIGEALDLLGARRGAAPQGAGCIQIDGVGLDSTSCRAILHVRLEGPTGAPAARKKREPRPVQAYLNFHFEILSTQTRQATLCYVYALQVQPRE
jgi:hypothetical protein